MFKNIQKQLLIKYPLLWNTRIVPMTAILIVINLIFFFIGYHEGELNFKESENNYNYDNDGLVVFFSVLVSILLLILWLVFYFKNNSFKSFYPKNKFSLFKEWSILLFISFLITLFTVSFYYGKETRVRGYYSETEAKKRCEILSKASFFVDGSYSNNYRNDNYNYAEEVATETDSVSLKNNFIIFNGKNYSYTSLLNKNVNSYTFFDYETDSLRKKTIKTWLVKQQKDSIKNVFKNYLNIAKEHNLKANIDENKWFDLVYNYPNFDSYKLIGKSNEGEYYYPNNYTNGSVFDSVNKYIASIGNQQYEYYKYYVPESQLNFNYNKISDSWSQPDINFETILIALYFAFGLSLLIFSFRVTSGKNWLISVVSVGVLGILFGIISLIIKWDYTFPVLMITTILFTIIYFAITLSRNKSKNVSGVMVNVMLWSILGLLPLIYFVTLEILKDLSHQYNLIDYTKSEYYPTIQFMKDNIINFMYFNLIFSIIIMLVFSSKIKKWRGLAEN
ncbi:hypothetical protein [Flavobacterium sp.]|uniref:hypothetical protein n=1 Tax=Flavobacterium sp. TaxID=239 RepID=UPI0026355AD4|nr:hypothetical protein [Flavobacterium sp.]